MCLAGNNACTVERRIPNSSCYWNEPGVSCLWCMVASQKTKACYFTTASSSPRNHQFIPLMCWYACGRVLWETSKPRELMVDIIVHEIPGLSPKSVYPKILNQQGELHHIAQFRKLLHEMMHDLRSNSINVDIFGLESNNKITSQKSFGAVSYLTQWISTINNVSESFPSFLT